jgi:hypothetical protein
MVWSHDHSPRFSYGRDFRPRGVYSYGPGFWADPMAAASARRSRTTEVAERARASGEQAGRNEMFMIGGAILGTVAVGALILLVAKKN